MATGGITAAFIILIGQSLDLTITFSIWNIIAIVYEIVVLIWTLRFLSLFLYHFLGFGEAAA